MRAKISSFLQHSVNLLKIDHRSSDFSDFRYIEQIINKEKQKLLSAGYLTRLWKICDSIIDYNNTRTLYTTHSQCVLELGKMFNTNLKGLLRGTTSGDKKEFQSFNLRKLSAKHAKCQAKIKESDNESQV